MAFHRVDADAISGLVTELPNVTDFVNDLRWPTARRRSPPAR